MIKKIFLMTLGVAIFFMNQATAAKLDYYRDLLIKNSYTIKYENITPAPRITNRDKVEIYGKSRALTEESDYLLNRPNLLPRKVKTSMRKLVTQILKFADCRKVAKIFSLPSTRKVTAGNISAQEKITSARMKKIILLKLSRAKVTATQICHGF